LWRGLKDMARELDPQFLRDGGSENAPMSTTTSLEVAVRYSASAKPTLLRLRTKSSYERGADDLHFLAVLILLLTVLTVSYCTLLYLTVLAVLTVPTVFTALAMY
jgi:hypothetical protein